MEVPLRKLSLGPTGHRQTSLGPTRHHWAPPVAKLLYYPFYADRHIQTPLLNPFGGPAMEIVVPKSTFGKLANFYFCFVVFAMLSCDVRTSKSLKKTKKKQSSPFCLFLIAAFSHSCWVRGGLRVMIRAWWWGYDLIAVLQSLPCKLNPLMERGWCERFIKIMNRIIFYKWWQNVVSTDLPLSGSHHRKGVHWGFIFSHHHVLCNI